MLASMAVNAKTSASQENLIATATALDLLDNGSNNDKTVITKYSTILTRTNGSSANLKR